MDKSIVSLIGTSSKHSTSATVSDNEFVTAQKSKLNSDWLQVKNASHVAIDNAQNGKEMDTLSNLNTKYLKAFTATKEAADKVEQELTTTFELDKNQFRVSALFTDYDQDKLGESKVYSYDALDNTYNIHTLNSLDIL